MNAYLEQACEGVRGLSPYQPGLPLEELERRYGIRDAVKLASNENPLGPSQLALSAIQSQLGELSRYPDGNGFNLKSALAEQLGVEVAQITLGNGSNDTLELVARAFVEVGDEVIFSEHAFAVYPIVTQAVGGKAVVTPARDYGHDLEAMQAAITPATKLIFIANPNNPTGTWLGRHELHHFLTQVPKSTLVVIDEAYFEFASDPELNAPDYPDGCRWLSEFPNLIVTRTFSKAYGLAGLRVGYAVSHVDVADLLNRVRQPFNLNIPALFGASAALFDHAHLSSTLRINREGLEQYYQGFVSLEINPIFSVGNFVCVDVRRSAGSVYEALLHEGVIVRPVANYGLPNHLRISVGLESENSRCLAALERVLSR